MTAGEILHFVQNDSRTDLLCERIIVMKHMNRKFKLRGFSFLVTTVFIGMMILLNVLTGMLTERFFIKTDLTQTGLYTISERATEFLEGISQTVDVVVLAEESTWKANPMLSMIINTLQNYSAATGGKLRIQYVNPELNYFDGPEYNNSLTTLKDSHSGLDDMARNDIIFISSFRAAKVSATDLFVQGMGNDGRPYVAAIRTDQILVSVLQRVLNENVPHAVFIANHDESPGEYIKFVLDRSGYTYSSINLALEDIPDDTTVVFTVAPKYDFLSNEIIKLEHYLISGGNVVVLYDFMTISLPVLDAFLAEWGVSVENKLIFDEVHTYIPQYGIIATHVIAGHLESTVEAEEYTRESMPVGAVLSRPLSQVWVGEMMSGFSIYPLIRTISESSYAKSLDEGASNTPEREPGDESGPFVIAYNVRRLIRETDGSIIPANLIIGGADMFDDSFLSMFGSTFYNASLIADLASDFNPDGQSVFIPAKPLAGSQMPVSSGNARFVLILMVITLPAAIYTAAVIVWYKRRHK